MRRTQLVRAAPAVALGLLLAGGCRSVPTVEPSRAAAPESGAAPESRPPEPAKKETAETPIPPAVRQALLPPMATRPSKTSPKAEPHFDIAVNDASARDFFLHLVQDTPYNVVVAPDVKGKISLTLKHATIPEIVDAVHQVYGYEYHRTGDSFYILPARLQTRIFQVNYLDLRRKGQSETRVSSGQLTDQSGNNNSTQPVGSTATSSSGRRRQSLASSLIRTESDSDVWKELTNTLKSIIGTGDGRSVVVSPETGIVVVRAMPDELRDVSEYLSRAQANLSRQVVIEAKIIEVTLNHGFQSGINWAQLITWAGHSILLSQTGGGTLLGDAAKSAIAGNTGDLNPKTFSTTKPSNTNTSAFGGIFSGTVDIGNFSAFIELLKTQGDVKVLSSPRVATVNNQKAVIKVGSDEFFVTDVSSTTVTGTATTTTPNITLTPFFSGIALDVTPEISADGSIILHVHPSVSEVVDQVKNITVAGQTQSLPLAFSTIRESDAIVHAQSGQMVVIGGLMKNEHSDKRAETPWLGKIPYLGALFRHQLQSTQKTELVILLRPTVVTSGDPQSQRAEARAQEIQRELQQDERTSVLAP